MLHGYIAFQVDYRKNTHLQARCDAKLKVKVHKLESHIIIIIIKYKKKAVCLWALLITYIANNYKNKNYQ